VSAEATASEGFFVMLNDIITIIGYLTRALTKTDEKHRSASKNKFLYYDVYIYIYK
jgi:hypothetical protein